MATAYISATSAPRRTRIKSVQTETVDRADSGIIRVAQPAIVRPYELTIEHPLLNTTQLQAALGFWADYQGQTIALARGDGSLFEFPLVGELDYEEVSPAVWNASATLLARRALNYAGAGYGSFEATPSAVITNAASVGWSTDAVIGARSLLITKTSSDGLASVLSLAASATTYPITIPANRRWIIIATYNQSVVRTITPALKTGNGTVNSGTAITLSSAGAFQRVARLVDLTASAQTTCNIQFTFQSTMASGETCKLDALVLHDVTGLTEITESNFPLFYVPPEA